MSQDDPEPGTDNHLPQQHWVRICASAFKNEIFSLPNTKQTAVVKNTQCAFVCRGVKQRKILQTCCYAGLIGIDSEKNEKKNAYKL